MLNIYSWTGLLKEIYMSYPIFVSVHSIIDISLSLNHTELYRWLKILYMYIHPQSIMFPAIMIARKSKESKVHLAVGEKNRCFIWFFRFLNICYRYIVYFLNLNLNLSNFFILQLLIYLFSWIISWSIETEAAQSI